MQVDRPLIEGVARGVVGFYILETHRIFATGFPGLCELVIRITNYAEVVRDSTCNQRVSVSSFLLDKTLVLLATLLQG